MAGRATELVAIGNHCGGIHTTGTQYDPKETDVLRAAHDPDIRCDVNVVADRSDFTQLIYKTATPGMAAAIQAFNVIITNLRLADQEEKMKAV